VIRILRAGPSMAAIIALGAGFVGPAPAGAQTPVALVVVDVKAVALGYRASKLIGRPVTNDQRQEIGKIDDLVIGRDKVLFAIIGVGGFLGIGAHLVVAPYDHLTVSPQRITMPGATKEALRKLPEFHYLP
jgi:hypothetical protein